MMSSSIPAPWYVVYSKLRREEYAQVSLKRKGIEVFFPRLLFSAPSSGPRGPVALFPRYLFVRFYLPDQYYDARWCPGVQGVVSFDGSPAPLADNVITFLKHNANPDGVLIAHKKLTVGQEVAITDGPFEGLKAIVQNPPDAKGRIRVLMRLLNRDLTVAVPAKRVKSEWVIIGQPAANATSC
ncbi:MAG: transcription termination/antitermination protein NusG [Candidatus Binatia bacterium]